MSKEKEKGKEKERKKGLEFSEEMTTFIEEAKKAQNLCIMGIDPGTAKTGCAVVTINPKNKSKKITLVESRLIETSKDLEMPRRLKLLHRDLLEMMREFRPDVVSIERLFFNTNVKTAMSVGQARGITMLAAAGVRAPVFEFTALEAKMVVTGYGRASKTDMQEGIKNFFRLKEIIKSYDANDGVAMALCFAHKILGYEIKS